MHMPQDAYARALAYIFSHADYARRQPARYADDVYGVQRVAQLLELLGHPETRYPCLHIAGTKGKGSTAAMLEACLRAAGYRTGLFASPSLHTTREYFRINGRLLPESRVAAGLDAIRPYVERVEGITAFEILTALAFHLFAEEGVEAGIIEVLMGGRLDATNVITPAVSIITSISYDHTQFLGSTLSAIAGEKAGIIKPGVPVVCAPQEPEALEVIQRVCQEKRAPLVLVGRDWEWRRRAWSPEEETGDIRAVGAVPAGFPTALQDIRLGLLGAHQWENAAVAVAALVELRRQGWRIDAEAVRAGLRDVQWPGRLEILGRRPWVVVDGAHNVESTAYLVQAVREIFTWSKLFLIFGASADKDIAGMLAHLVPLADDIIVTRSGHARAADEARLQQAVEALGKPARTALSVKEALQDLLAQSSPADMILATGSLFIAADTRRAWAEITGAPLPPADPPWS
jgi:dihydrofolate synthase/folylpolyglutamate synthase